MFNGVPVAATLLMAQALPVFTARFPGLEMSAVFRSEVDEEAGSATPVKYQEGIENSDVEAVVDGLKNTATSSTVASSTTLSSIKPDFSKDFVYKELGRFAALGWPSGAWVELSVLILVISNVPLTKPTTKQNNNHISHITQHIMHHTQMSSLRTAH